MTTLLLPIGHSLGTHHRPGTARDHVEQVRLGPEIVELSEAEMAVWALAHGPTEGLASDWDRAQVEAAAVQGGIGDAPAAIDRLLDSGLLARLDLDEAGVDEAGVDEAGVDGSAAGFARRHRLLPLHVGLGNSASSRSDSATTWGVFRTGTDRRPLTAMPWLLYELWLTGHLEPNLLAACEQRVLRARQAGVPGADTLDPRGLLVATLAALHTLLAPSAACLDLAMPGYRP